MSGISKRELIKKAYPGKAWSKKVDTMPESQVIAVYMQLKGRGKVA